MVDSGLQHPRSHWPVHPHYHYPSRKNSFLFTPFLFFCRNIADPESGLLLSSADWAHSPKPLPVWRAVSVCCVPAELPALAAACCQQDSALPSRGEPGVVAEEQPLLWQSGASVQTLLSLFTAFTLVQLRSLLQSKCWQAIFINHVRLNVFKCMYLRKNNHALVLFLFSSRPWGFFCFVFPGLHSLVQRIQFCLKTGVLD